MIDHNIIKPVVGTNKNVSMQPLKAVSYGKGITSNNMGYIWSRLHLRFLRYWAIEISWMSCCVGQKEEPRDQGLSELVSLTLQSLGTQCLSIRLSCSHEKTHCNIDLCSLAKNIFGSGGEHHYKWAYLDVIHHWSLGHQGSTEATKTEPEADD